MLYRPASKEERALADPPPEAFVAELIRRRVAPLSVGRVIVATCEPNETVVLDVIRELGLERQVIFNKGAVMILPSGMNKATGLAAALDELGLSPHNCVAIGDAENDHAFLGRAECGVAVANALPSLKEAADLVTNGDHGSGVRELIERILASDLAELAPRLSRHAIPLGSRENGSTVDWPPYGKNLLVTGASGSGKSTFATGLLERLAERGYQYCLIDPEGDYVSLPGAVVLGDAERPPTVAEMLDVLKTPAQSVVVNLLGIALDQRPEFFAGALTRLEELRVKTGRPHWIVADEAHHLMPEPWSGAPLGGAPRHREHAAHHRASGPGGGACPRRGRWRGRGGAHAGADHPGVRRGDRARGSRPAGNARFGRGAAVAARRRRRGGADPHDPLAQRAAEARAQVLRG